MMFIHGLVSGKFDDQFLRSRFTLNSGTRTIRNPEYIRVELSKTDLPFSNASHMYNHAALYIDTTTPLNRFKNEVQLLPDCSFGPWANI